MLDIAVAQLNLTVGDLDGNVRQMTTAARRAWEQQADVVVFPELALTGYYPGDLLADPAFLQRTEAAFHALLLASRQMPGLHWVVGLPVRHAGPGHGLHNALHVIRGGDILLTCAKQLLPTYNVFDERRHFDPGPDAVRLLAIRGVRVGFLICEDGWNDSGQSYVANPFERLRDAAPDLVVSINASPSNIGKRRQRHDVLGQAARRHGLPLLYVNHVGGHDQLVYDGASFAVEADGRVVFEARRFEPELRVLRFAQGRFWLAGRNEGDAPPAVARDGLPRSEFYRRQIVLGLRDYARTALAARQTHIQCFGLQLQLQFSVGQRLAAGSEGCFNRLLGHVDGSTARFLFLYGKLCHAFHEFGHATGLAQKLGLGIFQIGRCCTLCKQLPRTFDQGVQLVHIRS